MMAELIYSRYTDNNKVVTFGYSFLSIDKLISEEPELVGRMEMVCKSEDFNIETKTYTTPFKNEYILEVIVEDEATAIIEKQAHSSIRSAEVI